MWQPRFSSGHGFSRAVGHFDSVRPLRDRIYSSHTDSIGSRINFPASPKTQRKTGRQVFFKPEAKIASRSANAPDSFTASMIIGGIKRIKNGRLSCSPSGFAASSQALVSNCPQWNSAHPRAVGTILLRATVLGAVFCRERRHEGEPK